MRKILALLAWLVVFVSTDPSSAQTVKQIAKLDASGDVYFAVLCGGGESVAAVDQANNVHLWDLATGQHHLVKASLNAQVDPFAFACEQKTVAVGSVHGTVLLLDFDGQVKQRFDLKEEIIGLKLSRDGNKLAVSTTNSPIQLWDVASGSREWIGTTSFGNSNGVRISPDGKSVFAADGDTYLRAYDIKGKLIYAAEGDLLEPFDVSVSAGGTMLAAAGAEGRLELRDSSTGKVLKKSSSCGNSIFLVTMSPKALTVLALIVDASSLLPAGIGYWNVNDPQLKQLTVDPKTVVGMGTDAKGLVLIRQESPARLSIERVE
jgi:WD40 repeat protein